MGHPRVMASNAADTISPYPAPPPPLPPSMARTHESCFQALWHQTVDGFLVLDPDDRILDASPGMVTLCGKNVGELLMQDVHDLLGGLQGDANSVEDAWLPPPGQCHSRRIHAGNGKLRLVDVTVACLEDGARVVMMHDVCRHDRVHERLRRARYELRVILNSIHDAVLVVDLATRLIRDANSVAMEWLGIQPPETCSETLDQLVLPGSQENAFTSAWDAAVAGKPQVTEWTVGNHQTGHPCAAEVHLRLISLGEDEVMLCCLRDITERKHAERETLHALQRERELHQLKSRFVSLASHQFRTPLSVIQSSVELLESYGDGLPPTKRQTHFARIHDAVQVMTAMLEDLLFVEHSQGGRVSLHPTMVNVRNFFQDLLDIHRPTTTAQHRLLLRMAQPECWLHTDLAMMHHVFNNLLSNAIKYSPHGGEISIDVIPHDRSVSVLVQDQGLGIPAADVPQLFGSFHRGTNVGPIPGNGLGLVVARSAVHALGGSIQVTSEPGRGSCFTVTLPQGEPVHGADPGH